MLSFFGVPVDAAYHVVSALTGALSPLLGGLAAVAGIVLLTVAVRLIIMPLSLRAMRAQAIQARLAPELAKLRATYGKQPERLQREMTALYRREGTTMFAGLSPILLQWPFLSVMYLLFRSARIGGQPNTLLRHDLFGVPLGTHWLDGAGPVSLHGAVFLGVFVVLAVLCWRLARLVRAAQPAPDGPAGAAGVLGRVLAYLTVAIAAFVPLAAGVYLVTSTGWSLLERRLFRSREPAGSRKQAQSQAPDRPQHRTTVSAARRSLPDGPANRQSRRSKRGRTSATSPIEHT
jgi:YidC/Oxa1 family membrane protein insertase